MRILITAGPTREYFDSVRYITNPSSGKMGYAIAQAARDRGHDVTLITGPVSLDAPRNVRVISVVTAAEMAAAAKKAFPRCDAAIFTAAVCDYRPATRQKLKHAKTAKPMTVRLVPTEDIAATLGKRKRRQLTIGFAMEDHAARPHAVKKLRRKNCDAIVLNSMENVGADRARVEFLVQGGRWQRWPAASKQQIALRLLIAIETLAHGGVERIPI